MTHAAQDRVLVGARCQLRQVLGDLNTSHVRIDWVERAANLFRSIRLEVKRIQVRRTTVEIDEDAGLSTAGFHAARIFGAQKICQRKGASS